VFDFLFGFGFLFLIFYLKFLFHFKLALNFLFFVGRDFLRGRGGAEHSLPQFIEISVLLKINLNELNVKMVYIYLYAYMPCTLLFSTTLLFLFVPFPA